DYHCMLYMGSGIVLF
nr:immunoglobulin light chain junction region [Macaca mulatta]MOX84378.1 immunoglobulin light chain junction region [Macaca mulatta]